ncbi:SURF1 family protein [Gammaproteobacteria bacterium]|nr:SURF1 family protein [Gammaproteobacteria bacterium]
MPLRRTFYFSSFEIRVNWIIATCVVISAVSFANLGFWQLGRAAEKLEAQSILEAELRENAGPIENIPAGHLHRANPEMRNRHVQLQGEYLNDRTVLILAEFFDSQIGYGVVTPLRLTSNGELVLVHRGWTSGILPPDTPPSIRPIDGPVDIGGQIFIPPQDTRVIPSQINPNKWPLRMRSLEIDVISEILGEPIFPFEVRITANQSGTLTRHWPAVNPDVNQNLSYAIQWFTFALIIIFVALLASSNLWALLRGPNRH